MYTWRLLLTFFYFFLTSISLSYQNEVIKEFESVIKKEPYVAALFTKECCTCTNCVEAEALIAVMAEELAKEYQVRLIKLIEQPSLAKDYGVKDYPSLVFIRNGHPALYSGPFEKDALMEWFGENREVLLKRLDDDSFEHLTQAATGATTGDWLVAFHEDSCGGLSLNNVLDGLAIRVKGRTLVAHVDSAASPSLKERFGIEKCPTILFFRQGKMYLYDLPTLSISSLKSFVEGFYKNARAVPVPVPKTSFDKLVEESVAMLKENPMLALMAVGGFLLFIATLYGISEKKAPKEIKPVPKRPKAE